MKKVIFCLSLALPFIQSCAQAEPLTHTIKSEKVTRPHPQIEEFTSTFLLEYPIFKGNSAASLVNKDISFFINSVGCLDSGDRHITVEIKKQTDELLSLAYAASWMCDDMPRPDSTSGSLNYNLEKSTKISLNSVIIEKELKSFTQAATIAINADINSPEKNEDIRCTAQDPLDFYFDENGMTIFYQTTVNGFMACRGEHHIDNEALAPKLQKWIK